MGAAEDNDSCYMPEQNLKVSFIAWLASSTTSASEGVLPGPAAMDSATRPSGLAGLYSALPVLH